MAIDDEAIRHAFSDELLFLRIPTCAKTIKYVYAVALKKKRKMLPWDFENTAIETKFIINQNLS